MIAILGVSQVQMLTPFNEGSAAKKLCTQRVGSGSPTSSENRKNISTHECWAWHMGLNTCCEVTVAGNPMSGFLSTKKESAIKFTICFCENTTHSPNSRITALRRDGAHQLYKDRNSDNYQHFSTLGL